MSGFEVCPHCDADLRYVHNGEAYTRAISVEVRGVYDGGLFYQCPECDECWHRWTDEDPFSNAMRAKAEAFWYRQRRRDEV